MIDPSRRHKDYDRMAPVWKLCRDAAEGERAVQEAGKTYLPMLAGQDKDAYAAYKLRAAFFPATGRTIEGMLGLVFRKDPVVTAKNATFLEWLKNITTTGISLEDLARDMVEEDVTVGRAGLLVDMPPAPTAQPGAAPTLADVEAAGIRPYIVPYKAEQIINWEYRAVGNETVLYRVRLEEGYLDENEDEQIRIRELTIASGEYQQIVYLKGASGWTPEPPVTPQESGAPLKRIPFYFVAPKKTINKVANPPIEGLARVNISHYRNSADLENGAHISGLPTAYFTCDEPEKAPEIYLGSSTAVALPLQAVFAFASVGSEGFATLEKLMDRKESQMAVLGARLIAPEKKQAETAETTQTKKGSETSVLADLARSASNTLTEALQKVAAWGGIAEEVKVELNRDYLILRLSAQELSETVKAWQAGAISDETKFYILKAGEMIEESVKFEDEQERIAAGGPPAPKEDDDIDPDDSK